jgi:hypothetical protein
VQVLLLPLGRGRHELYGEPPEVDEGPLAHDAGRLRRWLHAAGNQWHGYVDAARTANATRGFAKWRDATICKLADTMDEQRTLRSLRTATTSTMLFPSGTASSDARRTLTKILSAAQRHHGQWLGIYLLLFIASGILFFVPGPNIVAYYLGFQAFGHLQAWRGARRASSEVEWTLTPSDELAELAKLAEEPHASRMARVDAIAERLELPHLPAFFERAAA